MYSFKPKGKQSLNIHTIDSVPADGTLCNFKTSVPTFAFFFFLTDIYFYDLHIRLQCCSLKSVRNTFSSIRIKDSFSFLMRFASNESRLFCEDVGLKFANIIKNYKRCTIILFIPVRAIGFKSSAFLRICS